MSFRQNFSSSKFFNDEAASIRKMTAGRGRRRRCRHNEGGVD
jgi:hypothetical protein